MSDCAPSLGRYEFVLRRLHSLTGLMPIGGYLAFHLLTNASIVDGVEVYQRRADQIHQLGVTTVVLLLEWPIVFLPILFHGILGLLIVCRGKRNLTDYRYVGNLRYTLQRTTGVIAFLFILWHVFHMHGWLKNPWWMEHVVRPLGGGKFDPRSAFTAAEAIQASIWIQLLYGIGVLACVYHLANGLWTLGITWGIWTSPRAQRWANVPCAAVGVFLAVAGLAAIVGMAEAKRPVPRAESAAGTALRGVPAAATEALFEAVREVSPLPLGKGPGVRAYRSYAGPTRILPPNRPHPNPPLEGDGTYAMHFSDSLLASHPAHGVFPPACVVGPHQDSLGLRGFP